MSQLNAKKIIPIVLVLALGLLALFLVTSEKFGRVEEEVLDEGIEVVEGESEEALKSQIESLESDIAHLENQLQTNSKGAYYVNHDGVWEESGAGINVPDELIAQLPDDWDSALFSRNFGDYSVTYMKTVTGDLDPEVLAQTKKLMPFSYEDWLEGGEVVEHSFAIWFSRDHEFIVNGRSKIFPGGELIPIATLYWHSPFGGCGTGLDEKTGEFTISCGMGDNGCSINEYSRVSIFDGSIRNTGMCSNNCDLGPEETPLNICSSGKVEPAWQ